MRWTRSFHYFLNEYKVRIAEPRVPRPLLESSFTNTHSKMAERGRGGFGRDRGRGRGRRGARKDEKEEWGMYSP